RALDASCSSRNPRTALNTNNAIMITKSPKSWTASAMIAAASIIQGIGPQKKFSKIASWLFFFSSSALGPYCFSRDDDSAALSPLFGSTLSCFNAPSLLSPFQWSESFGEVVDVVVCWLIMTCSLMRLHCFTYKRLLHF